MDRPGVPIPRGCIVSVLLLLGAGLGCGAEAPPPAVPAPLQQATAAVGTSPAPFGLDSLKRARVPGPDNLSDYVKDRAAAVRLGKAFFWEMQAGSDGKVACASCHFHAGTDGRVKNQVRPVGGRFHFGGPNRVMSASDYPFHRLASWDDRHSLVTFDTPNRTASQGIARRDFVDIVPGQAEELGVVVPDPVFNVGGVNVRRSAAGNAPTVINAVFNFRQLIVGFPQEVYNGANPLGARDTEARVYKLVEGRLVPVEMRLRESSIASQTMDPPVNGSEMAYLGRTFPKLGKKLLSLRPLARQEVAPNDSVLGTLSRFPAPGLDTDYASLIQAAFQPELWSGQDIVTFRDGKASFHPHPGRPLTTSEFTQLEANFSLFWGLALQCYLSTLVSDDSRFDRVMEGRGRFTPEEEQGFLLFTGQPDRFGRTAHCASCHLGPEFTSQSVANVSRGLVERITTQDGQTSLIDVGFRNIGVRRPIDLPGLATDLAGFGPLSFARYAQRGGDIDIVLSPPLSPLENTGAVNAAYKVPTLRNIDLTGPYMHNGGLATLRQVVDFYNRGGDFSHVYPMHVDGVMQPLGLNEQEKEWLVAFLLTLTDERVRHQQAPFDHPQLFVAHGHQGDERGVVDDGTGTAVDVMEEIPAVGRSGGKPLDTYLGISPYASGRNAPPVLD